MSNPRLERFAEAYLLMAGQARYRPQTPSDGFGNISFTRAQCRDLRRWGARRRTMRSAFPPRRTS
jgi:hypothetical protein